MNTEVESLRLERDRLREEVEQLRQDAENAEFRNLKFIVPEVNVDVPPPPPPPAKREQAPNGR